jgi:hypothetical protein
MLAGIPAMQGATASDIIASILTRDPEPLALRRPDCPRALIDVISRALQKDREDRYPSVAEMVADLRSMNSAPVKPGNGSPRNALRLSWKAVTVVAVASAALAIVLILFLLSRPDVVIDSVAVLPILNEGGQSLQFVADGLTASLIGDLSEIPKLKVSSRAAGTRLKQSKPEARHREHTPHLGW